MRRLILIVLGIIVINCAGCKAEESDSHSVAIQSVSKGAQSGIENERFQIVRSDTQMNSLWSEHAAFLTPVPEKPVVDFSSEIIVAAFLGYTPTNTCLSTLDITSVKSVGKDLTVNVLIKVPRSPAMCIFAESPFEMIKLPRVSNYIGFNVEVAEYDL